MGRTQHTHVLPSDVVVKIAFLLQDWTTVKTFLEALHPANALGPLEHLWHLHFRLHWDVFDLWPRLNATRMDDVSRIHVEGIVKYYSCVMVDAKTDLVWFRQFGHLMKSIHWMGPSDTLSEWKSFPITSISPFPGELNQLSHAFDALTYLEEVGCFNCTAKLGDIIFKFAATSSNLQRLYLPSTNFEDENHCNITNSMGNDLLKCIRSRPIKVFSMEDFSWESTEMRDQVVRSVLSNPALEEFTLNEIDTVESLTLEVYFDRCSGLMTWRFCGRYPDELSDWSNFNGFLRLFLPLLETKVEDFKVIEPHDFGFQPLCTILEPSLRQSKVTKLEFGPYPLSNEDALEVAHVICDMSTLQELTFQHGVSFQGAKYILTASPLSLKSYAVTTRGPALTEAFNEQECVELKNISQRTDSSS
ncbi:hypothetical protein AeRB84_017365 [Aphanomyces euteiches]|nr:hypothetical protein AeRB84_017365 [Aphanomyces euteiches]